MRPIGRKPGQVALSREQREAMLIPWLVWTARRGTAFAEGLADVEVELAAAGVDPAWSWERFDQWVEEGE